MSKISVLLLFSVCSSGPNDPGKNTPEKRFKALQQNYLESLSPEKTAFDQNEKSPIPDVDRNGIVRQMSLIFGNLKDRMVALGGDTNEFNPTIPTPVSLDLCSSGNLKSSDMATDLIVKEAILFMEGMRAVERKFPNEVPIKVGFQVDKVSEPVRYAGILAFILDRGTDGNDGIKDFIEQLRSKTLKDVECEKIRGFVKQAIANVENKYPAFEGKLDIEDMIKHARFSTSLAYNADKVLLSPSSPDESSVTSAKDSPPPEEGQGPRDLPHGDSSSSSSSSSLTEDTKKFDGEKVVVPSDDMKHVANGAVASDTFSTSSAKVDKVTGPNDVVPRDIKDLVSYAVQYHSKIESCVRPGFLELEAV